MVLTQTTPHRWPDFRARRRAKVASTREDTRLRDGGTDSMHEPCLRGLFLAPWVHPAKDVAMTIDLPPPDDRKHGRDKPSRAAEYIAALYIALVLCAPLLLRETPWLTPPSTGVEMQMSRQAVPPMPVASATVQLPAATK
jgi:hypothetical protein